MQKISIFLSHDPVILLNKSKISKSEEKSFINSSNIYRKTISNNIYHIINCSENISDLLLTIDIKKQNQEIDHSLSNSINFLKNKVKEYNFDYIANNSLSLLNNSKNCFLEGNISNHNDIKSLLKTFLDSFYAIEDDGGISQFMSEAIKNIDVKNSNEINQLLIKTINEFNHLFFNLDDLHDNIERAKDLISDKETF